MSANTLDHDHVFGAYRGPIHARPKGARAALGMGVGACVILAAAALFARPAVPPRAVAGADAPPVAAAPAKIAAKASMGNQAAPDAQAPALDIEAPEFEREKKVASVAQNREGEERVDSVTAGQFALGAPFLRVDIHPELDPSATNPDFFLDMTRHARAVGLNVAKIGQRSTLSTRFGAFETADIRLSQPGGEGVDASERACLATRLLDPKVPLEIAAIACGSATRPIDRVSLACILDKVTYSAGSDNKALNDFFLNAEIARGKGCVNVSRDDLTASIPRKAGAKPVAQTRKSRTVARASAIHPEPTKN
ncbi:MAG: hypothetical protein ACR652_25820 [Methylocystis sp.]|uniref:hypothetical protein n=1 Tax=Methylocystis sp. TaxID=1911079 RepID=UPI003DA4DC60